jgi:hypothetical protein
MSQIGDFMDLFSPGGSFALLSCFERRRALMTLAHRTPESQAGFAGFGLACRRWPWRDNVNAFRAAKYANQ